MTRSPIGVGDTHRMVLVENLTRTQIVMYAGASGDYNPVHTDENYATQVAQAPSVFAHGMLTMGMTARLLTEWLGDDRLTAYSCRFQTQVWPGDSLTAEAEVTGIDDDQLHVTLTTTNQNGDVVLSGKASARTH